MTGYSLARFIADNDLVETLLRDHVPDRSGTHCRACGGSQSGRYRWPCDIHHAAETARARLDPPPARP